MKTIDPEECGKTASRLPPDQRQPYRESCLKQVAEDVKAKRTSRELRLKGCVQREKQLEGGISKLGGLSEEEASIHFRRGTVMCLPLGVTTAGEFELWVWTISLFGLLPWETNLVAAAIVLVGYEATHLYMMGFRRSFPWLENPLYLALGSSAFCGFFLLIFFGSEIRGALYQINEMIRSSGSPEEIVRVFTEFFKGNAKKFTALMVVLTSCVTLVGGVLYHDIRNRLSISLPLRRLHRELRLVRDRIQTISQEMISLDSVLPTATAEFDMGFFQEQVHLAQPEKEIRAETTRSVRVERGGARQVGRHILAILAFPIVLILLAFLFFLLFTGSARGEAIVLFDLSKSMAAGDYAGKETEFQKNVKGVEDFIMNGLGAKESLKVVGITENSFGKPYFLLEGELTGQKGTFGEVMAREKVNLLNKWRGLHLQPISSATDVFGALFLAPVLFRTGERRLIILSDLRHNCQGFDLETPSAIHVEAFLRLAKQKGLIADLAGVKVWCLGVHSNGKGPVYWTSLKEFWGGYFKEAHAAELKSFSMERRVIP